MTLRQLYKKDMPQIGSRHKDRFEENAARHSVVLVLIFAAILQFFGLGASEVQPWDEGLYAYRAEYIYSGGSATDQTEGSLGGLYSSTYPPLTVWAMSAAFGVFGVNAFAVRLFSVLCSGAALALTYLVARKFLNKEYSLAAALALASTLSWQAYSRQGMTDVPLVCFILLSLWGALTVADSDDFRKICAGGLAFGVGLAAALMTKIVISFLPILFAIALIASSPGQIKRNTIIFFAVLGLAAAAPWHIMMAARHGIDFLAAFSVPHMYSVVENNTRSSGILYYANQLVSASPFAVLSIAGALAFIAARKRIASDCGLAERLIKDISFVWFVGGLLVFSLSATKMPHYAVYLLPPGLFIATDLVRNARKYFRNGRHLVYVTMLFACGIVWSFTIAERPELKQNLHNPMYFVPVLAMLAAFAGMIIALALGRFASLVGKSSVILRNVSSFALIVCLVRITMMNVLVPPGEIGGAREVCDVLLQSRFESFVYVYHEHNPADSLNPQLNWYLKMRRPLGRAAMEYRANPLSAGLAKAKEIVATDTIPSLPLLYYVSGDRDIATKVIRDLAETRPIVSQTRNYVLFGKKAIPRSSGVLI